MGRRDERPETSETQAARFRRADPALLADVEAHAARVVRFKGYYIPASDRGEIVQEVMTQLWQALSGTDLRLRGTIFSLAEVIACRRCVDWMRRHRSAEALDETIVDRAARPDEALLRSEREDLGRRVLGSLRAPCADLIRRVVDEGVPYAEVAKEQGRSEHALRTKMWQCLQEARAILRRLSGDEPRRSLPDPR